MNPRRSPAPQETQQAARHRRRRRRAPEEEEPADQTTDPQRIFAYFQHTHVRFGSTNYYGTYFLLRSCCRTVTP